MGCCGSREWNVGERIQAMVGMQWVDVDVVSVTGSAADGTDVYVVQPLFHDSLPQKVEAKWTRGVPQLNESVD